MNFNSVEFLLFFFGVFYAYWLLPHRRQNLLLLLASYFFYACWDWRFLSLVWASTLIDFESGRRIAVSNSEKARKTYLVVSLTLNLVLLGFFKYFNFFLGSALDLLGGIGFSPPVSTLTIILPVGISFYTFQSMSYSIDIYRRKLEPARSFFDFALYVSFFPQLVAGPIERATNLLPQIQKPRAFEFGRILSGFSLASLGFFKKVVIADNLAVIVDPVFANVGSTSSSELLFATVLFALQIYFDFAAYTDIARGAARALGFDLTQNFDRPFLATNPVEFWERWHMSLSSWFKDYLYFPLALRYLRKPNGFFNKYKAHFIAMALIGFWHGADWNFIVFGLFWGVFISLYASLKSRLQSVPTPVAWVFHTCLVILSFFVFRIESLSDVSYLFWNWSVQSSHFPLAEPASAWIYGHHRSMTICLIFSLALIGAEWLAHRFRSLRTDWTTWSALPQYAFALVIVFATMMFRCPDHAAFIYFQF